MLHFYEAAASQPIALPSAERKRAALPHPTGWRDGWAKGGIRGGGCRLWQRPLAAAERPGAKEGGPPTFAPGASAAGALFCTWSFGLVQKGAGGGRRRDGWAAKPLPKRDRVTTRQTGWRDGWTEGEVQAGLLQLPERPGAKEGGRAGSFPRPAPQRSSATGPQYQFLLHHPLETPISIY